MKIATSFVVVALCALPAREPSQSTAPLEQHEWLQQLVGEWNVTTTVMEPGGSASTWESTEHVRSIGGRWIVVEGTADHDGEPFTSLLTLGYDPDEEAFVGSWVDTVQTTLFTYTGQLDASKRTLTLEAEGPSFADPSQHAKYRDQIELSSPDHRRMTSSMLGVDGNWKTYAISDARRAGPHQDGVATEARASDQRPAVLVEYLEIVTPDVDATCDALEEMHGTSFSEPVPELGNARTAALAGGGRIGVRAPMRADEESVVRPYVLVDDIESAAKAAKAAGAEFAVPPTEIPGQGKFAIYFQGGIQHGLWEL